VAGTYRRFFFAVIGSYRRLKRRQGIQLPFETAVWGSFLPMLIQLFIFVKSKKIK
jgi:hypothetical protein